MALTMRARRNIKNDDDDRHRSVYLLTVKVRKNSRQTSNTHKKNQLQMNVLNTNMSEQVDENVTRKSLFFNT